MAPPRDKPTLSLAEREQDGSFDHRVRDEVELDRIARYVEYNPVSAGLAANPRAWRWSSGRWLEGESACPTVGANPREM